jgi:N-methylhydantoinase A
MLVTDLRRDVVRTRLTRLDRATPAAIETVYADMAAELARDFAADGIAADRLAYQRYADMRYAGQEHSVKVSLPAHEAGDDAIAGAVRRFHDAHEREYGFRLSAPVELVNFHLAAFVGVDKPELPLMARTGRTLAEAVKSRRAVDFDEDGVHDTSIYDRDRLEPAMVLAGPAIIEEPASTILILPGQTARVDDYGNIHIAVTAANQEDTA